MPLLKSALRDADEAAACPMHIETYWIQSGPRKQERVNAMNAMSNDKLRVIFGEVIARNPGESEFHQAVLEVLECLGPVLARHPEIAKTQDYSTSLRT